MKALSKTFAISALLLCGMLSGCAGGPIAQQIASSLALKAADKVTADAMDAYDKKQEEESKKMVFKNTEPDEYLLPFITSNFASQNPSDAPVAVDTIISHDYRQAQYQDPNPRKITQAQIPQPYAQPIGHTHAESARLVQVEVWNVIIGDEKNTLMQKAALLGSENVPPLLSDWQKWQMATGNLQDNSKKTIYFLVPPSLGRITSGEHAYVEIADVGGLHIARYLSR